MQIRYGSHSHALNEAAVAIQREPLQTRGDFLYGFKETWTITGFLQADTTALLEVALNKLDFAYAFSQNTIQLIDNNGIVARAMPGRTILGGTRVIGGVSYPQSGETDAEFSTFRRYMIQVEGMIPANNVGANTLLNWTEHLTFSGGGPRDIHLQPLTGLPQKQRVADSTPYRVQQIGSAVGLGTWPTPPPPIWPAAENQDQRRITPKHPKRAGGLTPIYLEYEVEWSYQFTDAQPLNGIPTLWQ